VNQTQTPRPSFMRKPQDWEHPDRPLVCDIYAAENAGWRIDDMGAWNAYRIALTSPREPAEIPGMVDELTPLAEQARSWLAGHRSNPPNAEESCAEHA
jgi:hypothetical protein